MEHLKRKKMYNRTIQEARVQELSNRKYGTDPIDRIDKLEEEVRELGKIIAMYKNELATIDEVKDELADCNFVLKSIFGIFDTTDRELIDIAIDKIKQREINPNYKR
jgi:NTP pyrophosphatase (non-canonical NTP hydrolase)